MSPFFARSWTLTKEGNTPLQNEDACRLEAFACRPWREGLLLALADGTSEAVYSGPWARALVRAAQPEWPLLTQIDWNARLDTVRREFVPFASEAVIPWYVRNKFVTQGSQATLLTATITREAGIPGRVLRAAAVGDGCLIVLRQGGQAFGFPLTDSQGFGQNPALITNRPQPDLQAARCEVQLEPSDLVLACSDALARWVMQCFEAGDLDRFFALILGLLEEKSPEERSYSIPASSESGVSCLDWLRSVCSSLPIRGFHRFASCERRMESQPRLRDDDTTLALCMGLEAPGAVYETVARLRDAFRAGVTLRPLEEAGKPQRSGSWQSSWRCEEVAA